MTALARFFEEERRNEQRLQQLRQFTDELGCCNAMCGEGRTCPHRLNRRAQPVPVRQLLSAITAWLRSFSHR